jgi:hypothetical protein
MTTVTQTTTAPSPLLNALDRATALALQEDAAEEAFSLGAERGAPEPPISADGTVAYLDGIGTQVAQVQAWLRTHPELLRILDAGIRNEVHAMEGRTNRMNLLINAIFTIIGAAVGLALPYVIAALTTR